MAHDRFQTFAYVKVHIKLYDILIVPISGTLMLLSSLATFYLVIFNIYIYTIFGFLV